MTQSRTCFFHPIIGFLMGALSTQSALADVTLESETSAGSGNLTQALSVSGDVPMRESGLGKAAQDRQSRDEGWNWKLDYTYSSAPPTASATGAPVRATSSDVLGSIGYQAAWSASLDLAYSKTPSEALSSFGPVLNLGYRFQSFNQGAATKSSRPPSKPPGPAGLEKRAGDEDDSEEEGEANEPFSPSLDIGLALGTTGYTQDFSTSAAATKRTKTKTSAEKIRQTSVKPQISGSPLPWLTLSLAYTRYGYDRDVNGFIDFLNQPRSIRLGIGGFADTLDGFADHSTEGELTFHMGEEWDLENTLTLSRSKTSGGLTHGWLMKLRTRTWDPIEVALGFERNVAPDQPTESLAIVSVSYRWD